MACKRSSVRPRYSPLSSQEDEIFDILTHKTVSKDFKLLTECFFDNSQFTAESMSEKRIVRRRQSILFSPQAKYLPRQRIRFYGESKLGRQVDALALGGDEGRDKLR